MRGFSCSSLCKFLDTLIFSTRIVVATPEFEVYTHLQIGFSLDVMEYLVSFPGFPHLSSSDSVYLLNAS